MAVSAKPTSRRLPAALERTVKLAGTKHTSPKPCLTQAKILPYLADFPWVKVETINHQVCAEHGQKPFIFFPDGHRAARDYWDRSSPLKMSIEGVAELCRVSHKLAPFGSFNLVTFGRVAHYALTPHLFYLPPAQRALAQLAIGNYISEHVGPDELMLALRPGVRRGGTQQLRGNEGLSKNPVTG